MEINIPEINERWKTSKGIFTTRNEAVKSLDKGESEPVKVYVMTCSIVDDDYNSKSVDILLGEECNVQWRHFND